MLTLSTQLMHANSNTKTESCIGFVDAPLPKVILNKPKSLNSLDLQMIRDFTNLLPKIEQYPAFWV